MDWVMTVVVAVAAIVIVVVGWVTIHQRNDYRDACEAAGGVVVKASRAHRVCVDRDAVIEVQR